MKVVINYVKGTPIGTLNGVLLSLSVPKLGSIANEAILDDSGIDPSIVDEVILGNILTVGIGQAPYRQAAIYSILSDKTERLTINSFSIGKSWMNLI
jgi:acetyl-CoA C-acetyltransferase